MIISPDAKKARAALADRELCRRRLLHFTQRFRPRYLAGWVHKVICHELEKFSNAVEAQQSPRLMLLLPPRTGKSTLVSEMFPAWHLGRFPNHEIIAASYNISLPTGFSRKVRALVREPLYQKIFADTQLDPDSQSTEAWLTTAGGSYVAAGVSGGITGKGSHVLDIDDPIKDAKEADSLTIREDLWDWFGSTAYTRLSPGGGVLWTQCMVGETQVTMADGSRKRLDSVVPGDKVAAWKDGELVFREVKAVIPQGYDDVFELKTGNHTVMANARHPFLGEDGEWHRLGDLSPGDKLVSSGVFTPEAEGNRLTEDQAYLLGFMFGDGWVFQRVRKYDSKAYQTGFALGVDEHLNARITGLFLSVFGVVMNGGGRHKRAMSSENANLGRWLLAHGLHGGAHGKRVPGWLFSESLAVRRRFLDGFVAADGTIHIRNKHSPRVKIGLCNHELVADLRHLARAVGYRATNIGVYSSYCQPPGSPKPVWANNISVSWLLDSHEAAFYTSAVRTITPAGKAEVYDLTIDDAHCFLADSLVSHNTHWNEDDGAGRIQNYMREDPDFDRYKILKFPAIAEEDEYLDPDYNIYRASEGDIPSCASRVRLKGEALHPERYTLEMLRKIEKTLTKRHWSALYQQNPTPEDGLYFTKDQFLPVIDLPGNTPRARGILYQSWDHAITEKSRSDFTVGVTLEQDFEDNVEVRDIVRGKWSSGDDIIERMLDCYEKWKPDYLAVEDSMIWKSLSATFWKRARERDLFPNLVLMKTNGSDKGVRAAPLQALMQRGRLRWPKNAHWYEAAERELLRFMAGGNHDDIVDAMAYAAQLIANSAPPPVPKSAKKVSWRDKLRISSRTALSHLSA